MSTSTHQSVLAFISTSALLAAAAVWAGDGPPDAGFVAARELEVELARQPAIYLRLDPQRRILEIRARGITLDRVSLAGIELVSQQALLRPSLPASPQIPALWRIKQGPGDTDREVIAPIELRPMPKEGEEEATAPNAATAPQPTATPIPEPPVSYRAQLENGWDLWVTGELPPQGGLRSIIAAIMDGWSRLRGEIVDVPPAITLAMNGDDARRIHHLLRTGMPILVTVEAN